MSDRPIKFPNSPSSNEDELSSHHSSEENISFDDGMSDYSPPWSSKKEDPEEEDEEDEDEDDADVDAEDDDDFDDDSDDDSESDFILPRLLPIDELNESVLMDVDRIVVVKARDDMEIANDPVEVHNDVQYLMEIHNDPMEVD
ncbi:RNA-directed DNA methylation 4-like [Miscanthus floridulus]|uniref:RNA-directed DNA methylation 4-like n=1 Tax=Miscanthus floridulus TaxID=154761 RepID=UPI003457D065